MNPMVMNTFNNMSGAKRDFVSKSLLPAGEIDQTYTQRMMDTTQRLDPLAQRTEDYGIQLDNRDF